MFIAPIAAIIPPAATSAALIYVGVLMIAGLKNIDFDDISQALPAAFMLIAMPILREIRGIHTKRDVKLTCLTGKSIA